MEEPGRGGHTTEATKTLISGAIIGVSRKAGANKMAGKVGHGHSSKIKK